MPKFKIFGSGKASSDPISAQNEFAAQARVDYKKLKARLFKAEGRGDKLLEDLSLTQLEQLALVCPAEPGKGHSKDYVQRVLIDKMPKTDLHVHGEAGFFIDVAMARVLAERNKVEFPKDQVDAVNDRWLYRGQEDFVQFLNDFLKISNLIQTEQDIEEIMYAFYKRCYEQNVVFSLPGISWAQCQDKMSFAAFNRAYNRALERGIKDFGHVSVCRFRYYQERHINEERFVAIRKELEKAPNPLIWVVGLAGDEGNFPLAKFKDNYMADRANRRDSKKPWYFLTSHMDNATADVIASSTYLDWFAHGRRIAEDEQLLEQMQELGMRFEICPLSDMNVYFKDIPTVAQHWRLLKLMERGMASLNSDDPSFFGGIREVYQQVKSALPVSFSQMLDCTLNGVSSASPSAMVEMKTYQEAKYHDYMDVVNLGLLKIQFFQYYWKLLPLLSTVADTQLQQQLFALEMKTPVATIAELVKLIPVESKELKTQLQMMHCVAEEIAVLSQKVQKVTVSLVEEYRDYTVEQERVSPYTFS